MKEPMLPYKLQHNWCYSPSTTLQNEKHEKYISKNNTAPITQGVIGAARRLPEKP
jgi:hypothetical protein